MCRYSLCHGCSKRNVSDTDMLLLRKATGIMESCRSDGVVGHGESHVCLGMINPDHQELFTSRLFNKITVNLLKRFHKNASSKYVKMKEIFIEIIN